MKSWWQFEVGDPVMLNTLPPATDVIRMASGQHAARSYADPTPLKNLIGYVREIGEKNFTVAYDLGQSGEYVYEAPKCWFTEGEHVARRVLMED